MSIESEKILQGVVSPGDVGVNLFDSVYTASSPTTSPTLPVSPPPPKIPPPTPVDLDLPMYGSPGGPTMEEAPLSTPGAVVAASPPSSTKSSPSGGGGKLDPSSLAAHLGVQGQALLSIRMTMPALAPSPLKMGGGAGGAGAGAAPRCGMHLMDATAETDFMFRAR